MTPAADGYVRTVRALLLPQDMSEQKFVKIVIGGKTFYYTPATDEADFFSGKMYEYRLTVTSEGIKNIDVEEEEEEEEVRGSRSSRTVTTKFINKKRDRMKQRHSIFPPAASLACASS